MYLYHVVAFMYKICRLFFENFTFLNPLSIRATVSVFEAAKCVGTQHIFCFFETKNLTHKKRQIL